MIMANIVAFLEENNLIFDSVANIFGIVGGIVGVVGFVYGKFAKKKAEECEKKIISISTEIDTIHKEVTKVKNVVNGNNSQIAQTINNSGMGYKDTAELVNERIEEKTKDMHRTVYSQEEPTNLENGDVWINLHE